MGSASCCQGAGVEWKERCRKWGRALNEPRLDHCYLTSTARPFGQRLISGRCAEADIPTPLYLVHRTPIQIQIDDSFPLVHFELEIAARFSMSPSWYCESADLAGQHPSSVQEAALQCTGNRFLVNAYSGLRPFVSSFLHSPPPLGH